MQTPKAPEESDDDLGMPSLRITTRPRAVAAKSSPFKKGPLYGMGAHSSSQPDLTTHHAHKATVDRSRARAFDPRRPNNQ